MNDLRERLEKVLAEHQRESGLHMIGGRERLIQRLLQELATARLGSQENGPVEQDGACC